MLKISELSRETGLSSHTLRFYEKHGLIQASTRSESGYRYYDTGDVKRVKFVQTARGVGFSLDDIAQLLSIRVDKEAHSCQEVTEITEKKLQDVNQRVDELLEIQASLKLLLESCCGGPENATHCSIMEALEARSVVNNNSNSNEHSSRTGEPS